MTKELKDFLLQALFITIVGVVVICGAYWASKGMEYSDSGETRILEKVFADGHVEYKAQYQVSTWFGMRNWRDINGNSLQCIQIKWSEDAPKRIIRDYSEEKALKCEQTRIDQWLAERKSEQVVSSEYIKYP